MERFLTEAAIKFILKGKLLHTWRRRGRIFPLRNLLVITAVIVGYILRTQHCSRDIIYIDLLNTDNSIEDRYSLSHIRKMRLLKFSSLAIT